MHIQDSFNFDKICSSCGESKELSMFNSGPRYKKSGKSQGYDPLCKECRKIKDQTANAKYRSNNRDKEMQRHKLYREKNPDKIRAYNSSAVAKFSTYKSGASKKGRVFELDFEGFGIDRIDSSVGYIYSNCTPCCSECNFMKQSSSVEEFEKQIIKIAKHRKLI